MDEQERIKLQNGFEIQRNDKKEAIYKNSNQEIIVPFLNLIKYSDIVQDEVMESFILHRFFDKLKHFQETSNINEESVDTFVKLLNDEEVELRKEEFIDLFKLTDFFKVNSLQNCLKNCLINNANDVDFMLSLKIAQEQTDDPHNFLNDEFSTIIESNVKNNINQCLKNEKIKNISISSVNRMIIESKENISNDILYQFIVQLIDKRHILFQYLDIDNLTDDDFDDLFTRYTNDVNEGKSFYYDFLPKNIMYIKKLKDQIRQLQKANCHLEDQLKKQLSIDIQTKTEQFRPILGYNKFLFFSTGTPDLLLNGIEIDLQLTYNPDQCKIYLKSILQEKINNIEKYDLLIYLAGGIPFLKGTLNDIYNDCNGPYVKPYIYGILIPLTSVKLINQDFNNCESIKPIINSICDTTTTGLCDFACLIGYLYNNGIFSEKFLKCCAAAIHFSPLITCLNRIIDNINVKKRDVIVVTSTLHTYFNYLLKQCFSPDEIFDFTLKCCNYIIDIQNENVRFPMAYTKEYHDSKFLSNLGLDNFVYFWEVDSYKHFNYCKIKPFDNIDNDYDEDNKKSRYISFNPIDPLSMKTSCGCSIIKGIDHNFLYISQSSQKGSDNSNNVNIFDPLKNDIITIDIKKFARINDMSNICNMASIVNKDQIEQVIFVCVDNSCLMNNNEIFAIHYLSSLASEIYRYQIPCVYGLITFNNQIKISCSLTTPMPNFAEKELKYINTQGNPHLWDAISIACDKLIEYTIYPNGNKKFKNAVNRIIVISAGKDIGSQMNLKSVAKKMVENNIFVDSMIVNSSFTILEKCKELAALCHITGGLSFNPTSIEDGLKILEKSAFIKSNERFENINPVIEDDQKTIPKMIKADQINNEFIQNAVKCSKFDVDVKNKYISKAIKESKLVTVKHFCSKSDKKTIHQPRKRRILYEINDASTILDQNSPKYDPNIKIYLSSSSIDTWQVFLKGEDLTPYEGKWFYILVTFPELYPNEAPIFRFISIPYHLNISSEGKICLDILNDCYDPSMSVIDLIQQIKELFILARIENAVHIDILENFINNRDKYNMDAEISAQKVGKDDFKNFLTPDEKSIEYLAEENIQNNVMHTSGFLYEREELRALIRETTHTVPLILGRPLTEDLDDFV